MTRALIVVVALAGCAASDRAPVDRAQFDRFELYVPAGWASRAIESSAQRITTEWRPPADNPRKESLTIIRADRDALARAGTDKLEPLLRQANRLPGGRFGDPVRFVTERGLAAIRIDGDFVPPGQTTRYHRYHATLISGDSLVHVIYTAVDPDAESFDIVVNSLEGA